VSGDRDHRFCSVQTKGKYRDASGISGRKTNAKQRFELARSLLVGGRAFGARLAAGGLCNNLAMNPKKARLARQKSPSRMTWLLIQVFGQVLGEPWRSPKKGAARLWGKPGRARTGLGRGGVGM